MSDDKWIFGLGAIWAVIGFTVLVVSGGGPVTIGAFGVATILFAISMVAER